MKSPTLIKKITSLIQATKGYDIKIIDLKVISSLTDFFIICSSDSDPQTRAITNHIKKEFNNFDYPHLGSFIWSFFWQFPFGHYEYLGRIFYVFLYVLSVFSISNSLKLETYEKIIFSILLILLTYNYKLFSGLQDIVIFSVILLFSRFAFIIFQKTHKINNTLIFFVCKYSAIRANLTTFPQP